MRRWELRSVLLGVGLAVTFVASAPAAFAAEDPGVPGQPVSAVTEAQNYSKTTERQAIFDTPAYQAQLAVISAQNTANAAAIQAADPGRLFSSDLCFSQANGCAGDIRLNNWAANGYGIVTPVLFTARSGATLSGHVWATKNGPATRPGIVITNGSVQADEQFYWYAAQALAKDGYVVLTFDPQGQGQSDTPGAGADAAEGVPAQSDGRPFFDGTEDAIDFLLSTQAKPYEPIPSCNSGTSHADKQNSRVANGLDTAFNPYYTMLDPSRIGIAGHSYGATAVSYIAQFDPRVKAVVAWDNLAAPNPNAMNGGTGSSAEKGCLDPSQRTVPPVTKPALGMSADYYLPPEPNTTVPDPTGKETESLAYTAAGVDSGQVVIRGGTHFDFDWIPTVAFGATLRGADEIAWYTNAWMDKYVKADPTADARLLTNRWRTDTAEAAVDPNADGNDFSFYYRSRMDIQLATGSRFDCENLRDGCPGLVSDDGVPGSFDYLSYDTSPDIATAATMTTAGGTTTTGTARTGTAKQSTKAAVRRTRTKTVHQPTRTLAFTGGSTALPLAGMLLLLSGALLARRRRRYAASTG